MDTNETRRFLSQARALGLERTPKIDEAAVDAWQRALRDFSAEDAETALDAYQGSEFGMRWPSPQALRAALQTARQLQPRRERQGCPRCRGGARTAIQRIRRANGAVEMREKIVACSCQDGVVLAMGGVETGEQVLARCSNTPGARTFLTGSPNRACQDDTNPDSPWFTVPSPEELYGPQEGYRLRVVALGLEPMSAGAQGYLSRAIAK